MCTKLSIFLNETCNRLIKKNAIPEKTLIWGYEIREWRANFAAFFLNNFDMNDDRFLKSISLSWKYNEYT